MNTTHHFSKYDTFTSFFPDYPLSSCSNAEPLTGAKTVNLEETNNPYICTDQKMTYSMSKKMFILIHNSNIFMHWILYSVKFENRNGWNAGETDADTAQ